MKNFILLILLLVSFSIFTQENDASIKKKLDSLSKKQINYLCNGTIAKYLNTYSRKYTDLGGGPSGDGTVDFKIWHKKLAQFITSKKFNDIKGKSIEDILVLEKQQILNYTEIIEERGNVDRFSFKLKKGDYFISYPPKKNSPMFDGWFAFFRLENNEWKIIAGD